MTSEIYLLNTIEVTYSHSFPTDSLYLNTSQLRTIRVDDKSNWKVIYSQGARLIYLFDANDTLQKFEKVSDIIDTYYVVRLKLYQTRKEYMIDNLEKELVLLSNKAKYIKENLEGTIDLRKKKKEQVVEMLQTKGYDIISDDTNYHYLIKMPMDSVTEENVEKLLKERGAKETELETIKSTTINKMWLNELEVLKEQYVEYREERARLMNEGDSKQKKKSVTKTTGKKVTKKQTLIIED
jgi:DNA topoisomerase-2